MLQLPTKGFNRSATKNNIKVEVLGDWLEANILFFGNPISKVDVVDFLIEQQVCVDQNIGHVIADDGWSELRRRKKIIGIADASLSLDSKSVFTTTTWQQDPIRAFFVALSLFYPYPAWGSEHRNAPVQGLLFERVVAAISKTIFPGWETYLVGWSPEFTESMHDVVRTLGERLNCAVHPNLDYWIPDQAKDGGLDLVCYRPFDDDREAVPAYLFQCASGNNWRSKVNTPNPENWKKYLDSAVRPGTGIAAPFVIPAKKLRVSALEGQAIVLDRLRLLKGLYSHPRVIDDQLRGDVIAWLEPFVNDLPVLEDY